MQRALRIQDRAFRRFRQWPWATSRTARALGRRRLLTAATAPLLDVCNATANGLRCLRHVGSVYWRQQTLPLPSPPPHKHTILAAKKRRMTVADCRLTWRPSVMFHRELSKQRPIDRCNTVGPRGRIRWPAFRVASHALRDRAWSSDRSRTDSLLASDMVASGDCWRL